MYAVPASSHHAQVVLGGSADHGLHVWNVEAREGNIKLQHEQVLQHSDWVGAVSASDSVVFSGSDDGQVRSWSLQGARPAAGPEKPHHENQNAQATTGTARTRTCRTV